MERGAPYEIPHPLLRLKLNPLTRISVATATGLRSMSMSPPVPLVIVVLPIPAPIRLMCLEMDNVEAQVAVPAWTLIVSPATAFVTQALTLAKSGVLVHVGLDPVHAGVATFGPDDPDDPDDPPLPQLDARGVHSATNNNGRKRLTLLESQLSIRPNRQRGSC